MRRFDTEGLKQLQVLGRIHQVILAAQDVADFHFEIIHHIDEVEHIGTIGTFHHHVRGVGFIAVVDGDFTADQVLHGDRFAGKLESPGAIILVDAFIGAQFLKPLVIELIALALVIGTVVTTGRAVRVGALVPVQPKPAHA